VNKPEIRMGVLHLQEALHALAFCRDTLRRIEHVGTEDRCPDCGDVAPKHSQECYIEAALSIAGEELARVEGGAV
jgi:hypothetical protein